jgi:hypothetical protein
MLCQCPDSYREQKRLFGFCLWFGLCGWGKSQRAPESIRDAAARKLYYRFYVFCHLSKWFTFSLLCLFLSAVLCRFTLAANDHIYAMW